MALLSSRPSVRPCPAPRASERGLSKRWRAERRILGWLEATDAVDRRRRRRLSPSLTLSLLSFSPDPSGRRPLGCPERGCVTQSDTATFGLRATPSSQFRGESCVLAAAAPPVPLEKALPREQRWLTIYGKQIRATHRTTETARA